jgi:3-phenylpropionate/trans-cinnamate dioxygenase ferredoxin component
VALLRPRTGFPAAERRRIMRAGNTFRAKEGNMAPDYVAVAKAGDIREGEMAAFSVGDAQVAVANVSGTFYAFGDTCTHAQCSLAEGELEGTMVICGCHGSVFDVTTGAVLTPPAREPVPSYGVRVEGDSLQVGV